MPETTLAIPWRIVPAGSRLRLEFFLDGEWRRNAALSEDDEDSLAREFRDSEHRRAAA